MTLVTVFGGSGGIGRQVVKSLARRGYQVRVAVRDPQAALFLKPMGDVGQVTPVQANIREVVSVGRAVAGANAVVNLVGILHEGGAQRFGTVQGQGAASVAEAAAVAGVKSLVHISAIGASTTSPSAYARSKAAGEAAVRKAFPGASILRPSVVFGPHDEFFIRFAAMARLPIPLPVFGCGMPRMTMDGLKIYGDGGTRFQPVYVGDVADAVVACLERPDTRGRLYELGGPRTYSFCEIMELVLQQTRRWRPLIPVPFGIASLIGFFAEFLPKPLLTRDQVKQLAENNVVSGDEATFADLGIEPKAAEVMLTSCLEVYRRGGRYTTTQPG
jgi:NADH dehydrogenase